MKKWFILCCLLGWAQYLLGQNYYKGKSTVTAEGTTYAIRYHEPYFLLKPSDGKYEKTALYYKDGRPYEEEYFPDPCIYPDDQAFNEVLKETFTQAEYERLSKIKNRILFELGFVIGPDGNILAMNFLLSTHPDVVSLPPERFVQLERNMKAKLHWELTDFGKQLKACFPLYRIFWDKLKLDYSNNGSSGSSVPFDESRQVNPTGTTHP